MTKRGALIAIEGLDRTGKTTQTSNLLNHLSNLSKPHQLIKFPDRSTQIGKLINQYLTDKSFELSDQAAHLLFSANRWELVEKIKRLLGDGVCVILDRYVYSGVAYSSAKGLPFDWCLNPDVGLPKPDLTIFLKFANDENMDRDGFGDERYEVVEFQKKVKEMFEKFTGDGNWKPLYVDGKGIEEVERDIWAVVEKFADGTEEELQYF